MKKKLITFLILTFSIFSFTENTFSANWKYCNAWDAFCLEQKAKDEVKVTSTRIYFSSICNLLTLLSNTYFLSWSWWRKSSKMKKNYYQSDNLNSCDLCCLSNRKICNLRWMKNKFLIISIRMIIKNYFLIWVVFLLHFFTK